MKRFHYHVGLIALLLGAVTIAQAGPFSAPIPSMHVIHVPAPSILHPLEGKHIFGPGADIVVAGKCPVGWHYQLQWQRSKIGNGPGDWPLSGRMAWKGPFISTDWPCDVQGQSAGQLAHLPYEKFRSNSQNFHYRYWVRARYHGAQTGTGPWSPWRSFDVYEPIKQRVPPSQLHPRLRPGIHQ